MKIHPGKIVGGLLLLAVTAGAQPAPPPPDGGGPGGPGTGPAVDRPPPPDGRRDRDDRGGPPGLRGGGDDRGGPRGGPRDGMRDGPDGNRPPGPGGGQPPRPGPYEAMRIYLDLVDRYARIARDPTQAGVAAVVQTADVLKPRGAAAVIEHFEKLLPEVKNEAVARAIRLQLVDLYRQTQQADKAVTQLSELIKTAPAGSGAAEATPGNR